MTAGGTHLVVLLRTLRSWSIHMHGQHQGELQSQWAWLVLLWGHKNEVDDLLLLQKCWSICLHHSSRMSGVKVILAFYYWRVQCVTKIRDVHLIFFTNSGALDVANLEIKSIASFSEWREMRAVNSKKLESWNTLCISQHFTLTLCVEVTKVCNTLIARFVRWGTLIIGGSQVESIASWTVAFRPTKSYSG